MLKVVLMLASFSGAYSQCFSTPPDQNYCCKQPICNPCCNPCNYNPCNCNPCTCNPCACNPCCSNLCSCPDFTSCSCNPCDFTSCSCNPCDFTSCSCNPCDFTSCNCNPCDFTSCNCNPCDISSCSYSSCDCNPCTCRKSCRYNPCDCNTCSYTPCNCNPCNAVCTTVVDNSVSLALANALQLLIISNLIDSKLSCNEPITIIEESPCCNDCGDVTEVITVPGNCDIVPPVVPDLGSLSDLPQCLAEALFPASIPAQLVCNFGYVPKSVPCLSFDVKPVNDCC